MSPPSSAWQPDAIFVSYDGLLEPLGHSQVLPYVLALAGRGIRIQIVSFEKPSGLCDSDRVRSLEKILHKHQLVWTRLRYHRRPKVLSTLFDLFRGSLVVLKAVLVSKVGVLHARSYVPALMCLPARWIAGARLIFDIRGFWPEERVELGLFRAKGFLYRVCKILEKVLWRCSDRLVVLTRRARAELAAKREWQDRSEHIHVIPCCVDLERFAAGQPSSRLLDQYGLDGKVIVGNIGAVSRLYLLPEMFRFAVKLKSHLREIHLVYLTRQDPELLYEIASQVGLDRGDLTVNSVLPDDIPNWLSLFQLAVFFPKPCYATRGMSPTKLGEFLAAGVPVVTTASVGDIAEIVVAGETGIPVRDLSDSGLDDASKDAAALFPLTEARRRACRAAAKKHFAIEDGCQAYLSLYRELLGPSQRVIPRSLRESA